MPIHSQLWWRIARWRIRSRIAYSKQYSKVTGHRPLGEHRVPLLGLGGLVIDSQRFPLRQWARADKFAGTVNDTHNGRMIRAYRAAMGHYLANMPYEPALRSRE